MRDPYCRTGLPGSRPIRFMLVAAAVFGLGSSASAADIPTGNPEVVWRWDNTLRYTLAERVQQQKTQILNNPNADDGDRNLAHGIVSDRLDLLSEMDIVFHNTFGARVSGAGWFDQRYRDAMDNTSVGTSNHLENGMPAIGLSDTGRKYFTGPSGELLDAFVFAKFDLGSVPVNVKVGRHTLYWGEGLLLEAAVHGIAYGQMSIDVAKGLNMPGVEAKELYRPLNQISFQAQLTSTFSVAGQYYLQWEQDVVPNGGSYLGLSDVLGKGPESLIAGPGQRLTFGDAPRPKGQGDYGFMARWNPDWLGGGSLGFYYRKFTDKLPQAFVRPAVASLPFATFGPGGPAAGLGYMPLGAPAGGVAPFWLDTSGTFSSIAGIKQGLIGQYYYSFASDIPLYGLSFSKQILGVAVGSEVSYRKDMPLLSDPATMLPSALANPAAGQISAMPQQGQSAGARGNETHALINFMGLGGKTPFWDTTTWVMEYTFERVGHLSQGQGVFRGRDSYGDLDKCTRDSYNGAINFTPTWFQVLPSCDLSMPINYSRGLSGNTAVQLGGNKNAGQIGAGFSLDMFIKYKASLQYVGFFGTTDNSPGKTFTNGGGPLAMLSDRGMVVLTLKATF